MCRQKRLSRYDDIILIVVDYPGILHRSRHNTKHNLKFNLQKMPETWQRVELLKNDMTSKDPPGPIHHEARSFSLFEDTWTSPPSSQSMKVPCWGIAGTIFLCVAVGVYTVHSTIRDECVPRFLKNDCSNNYRHTQLRGFRIIIETIFALDAIYKLVSRLLWSSRSKLPDKKKMRNTMLTVIGLLSLLPLEVILMHPSMILWKKKTIWTKIVQVIQNSPKVLRNINKVPLALRWTKTLGLKPTWIVKYSIKSVKVIGQKKSLLVIRTLRQIQRTLRIQQIIFTGDR